MGNDPVSFFLWFLVLGLLIFWLISILKISLRQLYLWQLKEYRWDRMVEHLKTVEGRRNFIDFFSRLKFIFSILLIIIYFIEINNGKVNPNFISASFILFFLLYFIESLYILVKLIRKKIARPRFTAKILFILGVNFILTFLAFILFFKRFVILGLLLVNIIWPLVIVLIILTFKPIIYFLKRRIIKQAQKKIKKFPGLKIIGVTGSFGKSSTKEFLATILEEKFKVLKTPLNINTDIGVAQTILKKLNKKYEIFIVEMGAYKKGEIKEICAIVKPQIGILTGINAQHLALFGRQENITRAKTELIDSLPSHGLAVFNADSAYIDKAAQKFKGKKIFYSLKNQAALKPTDSKTLKNSLEFEIAGQLFKVNIVGEHNISNLLAAIAVAQSLGMSLTQIAQGAVKIKPFRGTMEIKKGLGGAVIIDDSYNSNPDGFFAALEHLKKFDGFKKIIITPGLLELGQEAKKIHQKIGQKMSQEIDELIITNKNYVRELQTGFGQKIKVLLEKNPRKIIQYLEPNFNEQTVILLEGRLAPDIIKNLT